MAYLYVSPPPLEIAALTTSRIYFMIYSIRDITHIDKISDYVDQNIKCLCKPIGCEAHEGEE